MMKPNIIFEDNDLLILDKPAGVVVNEASSVRDTTIQLWARSYIKKDFVQNYHELIPDNFSTEFGTAEEIFQHRWGMVHRLDKDTSGVLVFAKNPGALVWLLGLFKERKVQKTYICLVHGSVIEDSGQISLPIQRRQKNRKLFAVGPKGRLAHTDYQVISRYTKLTQKYKENLLNVDKNIRTYDQGFTLLSCKPLTGRTHQIRVHLSHLSHPLVGDVAYLGQKRAKLDPLWCPRQFLHASEISLQHPRTKKIMTFQSELPHDLQNVLSDGLQ